MSRPIMVLIGGMVVAAAWGWVFAELASKSPMGAFMLAAATMYVVVMCASGANAAEKKATAKGKTS